MIDGEYRLSLFKNDDDVWKIVNELIKETKEVNESTGSSFDVGSSIIKQIPFFACKNMLFCLECSSTILM